MSTPASRPVWVDGELLPQLHVRSERIVVGERVAAREHLAAGERVAPAEHVAAGERIVAAGRAPTSADAAAGSASRGGDDRRGAADGAASNAVPPARPALRVWVLSDDGFEGEGVAAPLGPGAEEELAEAERAMAFVPSLLAGASRPAVRARGPSLADEPPVLAALRALLGRIAAPLASSSSARFALETAALRLLAARAGLGVAEALRGGVIEHAVLVNALVSASDVGAVGAARALADAGYPAIKVKVGRAPWKAELEVVGALRAALPAACALRLDANGAWTLGEARVRLAQLAELGVALVEQPVAPEALSGLGACATPWAADESLAVDGMPAVLLEDPACAAFVIKPARLGLLASLDLAARAAARGKGVIVTHFFDGTSALEMACDLALSLGTAPLACGLAPWDEATRSVPHLRTPGRCALPVPARGGAGEARGD